MNPVLVTAIPLVLIILGMILNGLDLRFEQPPSSAEKDPAKRLAAEREIYREFFSKQRERALKRQKRVGQFAWLVLFASIGSFIWLYVVTVKTTTISNRIAELQTLGTDKGKQTVLSVTLRDGNNSKYLIKPDKTVESAAATAAANEKVSSWELDDMRTALSSGDTPLPLGISLKMASSK